MEDFLSGINRACVEELKKRKLTVTTAESCTGGMIASSIVNISGASEIFKEGYITYSDEAKERILSVPHEIMAEYKAVSEQVASHMAIGAAKISNANISVSVTGVAGPAKEDDMPVGLVYIGCWFEDKVVVKEYNFDGDRGNIRKQATKEALKLVLDMLKGNI